MKREFILGALVCLLTFCVAPSLRAQEKIIKDVAPPSEIAKDAAPDAAPKAAAAADDAVKESAPSGDEYTIPEGTEFKLQLHTALNSKTTKPGDRVITTLIDPVAVEDREVLAKGLRVDGHVGEVKPARRRGKGGYLTVVFDTLEMPNGEKVAILGSLTEVFSSQGGTDPTVGPEGDLKGHGPSRKSQAVMVAAPAAAGAAAGGMGPGIAAAAGGLAAALILPHGQQAALSSGSLVGMRLDQDVTLTAPPPPSEK